MSDSRENGDAGGDRGTARQTAGSGAQGSRARGQEGAAGRGCGCEGRSRGTSVQKGFGRPEPSSSRSTRKSAAERAGLKPGDLVTELDGTPVRDAADLQLRLALLQRTGHAGRASCCGVSLPENPFAAPPAFVVVEPEHSGEGRFHHVRLGGAVV